MGRSAYHDEVRNTRERSTPPDPARLRVAERVMPKAAARTRESTKGGHRHGSVNPKGEEEEEGVKASLLPHFFSPIPKQHGRGE